MTDAYLTTVLEDAEHVAEQHDQAARTTDNQAHEYLRYAVLRVLEGESDRLPADWTPIDGVTVGYGSDDAMFDSWGSSEDWWESVPPQEACTRFRVFFPDDDQTDRSQFAQGVENLLVVRQRNLFIVEFGPSRSRGPLQGRAAPRQT